MKKNNHKNGHKKHMLLMLLCCLVPIVLMIGLRYLNLKGIALPKFSYSLIFLLCPLMHIFMMKGMMGHGGGCHGNSEEDKNNTNMQNSNQ